jgi:hypothetical protein
MLAWKEVVVVSEVAVHKGKARSMLSIFPPGGVGNVSEVVVSG